MSFDGMKGAESLPPQNYTSSCERFVGPGQQLSLGETALNPVAELLEGAHDPQATLAGDGDAQVVNPAVISVHGLGVEKGQTPQSVGVLVNQDLALRPEGFLDLLYGGELHGFKERRSGIASAPK